MAPTGSLTLAGLKEQTSCYTASTFTYISDNPASCNMSAAAVSNPPHLTKRAVTLVVRLVSEVKSQVSRRYTINIGSNIAILVTL